VWSDVLEVSFMTPDEEIVTGLVMSFLITLHTPFIFCSFAETY